MVKLIEKKSPSPRRRHTALQHFSFRFTTQLIDKWKSLLHKPLLSRRIT